MEDGVHVVRQCDEFGVWVLLFNIDKLQGLQCMAMPKGLWRRSGRSPEGHEDFGHNRCAWQSSPVKELRALVVKQE